MILRIVFGRFPTDLDANALVEARGRLARAALDIPGLESLIVGARRSAIAGDHAVEAAIVYPAPTPGGGSYAGCADTMSWSDVPDSVKGRLEVRRQEGTDLKGRHRAPPVARWDWDHRHRINYIGVACDAETWCEVGPPGFLPSEPLTQWVFWPPASFGKHATFLQQRSQRNATPHTVADEAVH